MDSALILGGYGVFGRRIAESLVKSGVPIIITGRNAKKANELSDFLRSKFTSKNVCVAIFDAKVGLSKYLKKLKPKVVINAVGPFQNSDYRSAEICIKHGTHYIDLADDRKYVTRISHLDAKAKKANIAIISGASTVPGLSSAVLEKYKGHFSEIDSLTYGIATAQKTERGLATAASILSYVGKPLNRAPNSNNVRYGWQNLYLQDYPELGRRWMANCDIPDFDLLPERYGIKSINFAAGMENSIVHLSIFLLSWLVRLGLPIKLPKYAPFLLKISHLFDFTGSGNSGMHMLIRGKDKSNKSCEIKWFIIARDSCGLQIPTVPAVVLAKKLINNTLSYRGASTCMGMITLDEYLESLKNFNISTYVDYI